MRLKLQYFGGRGAAFKPNSFVRKDGVLDADAQRKYIRENRVVFSSEDNVQRVAKVEPYVVLGHITGSWSTTFLYDGMMDNDAVRGTGGLGMKVYATRERAIASAKRYLRQYGRIKKG